MKLLTRLAVVAYLLLFFGFLLGPGVDPAHSTFLTPEDPAGAYENPDPR